MFEKKGLYLKKISKKLKIHLMCFYVFSQQKKKRGKSVVTRIKKNRNFKIII